MFHVVTIVKGHVGVNCKWRKMSEKVSEELCEV